MITVSMVKCGPVRTNTYIIKNAATNESLLIDPGSQDKVDITRMKEAIADSQLQAIIFTHAHYDHILGAKFFDVPSYLHANDENFLLFQPKMCQQRFDIECVLPTDIRFLEPKTSISSFSFDVIHTPGHTKGSVCLLFEDFILTGDTLFAQTMGRTDVCDQESAEAKEKDPLYDNQRARQELIHSLKQLAQLPDDLKVYPGHGVTTRLGNEKPWIKKL